MAIISSLLDTDLYKFTMMQTALHQFSTTTVEYSFKCRNEASWTAEIFEEINAEIDHFCSLRFTKEELSGTSRRVKWLFEKDIMILQGKPEIVNQSGGKTSGKELKINLVDNSITIVSDQSERTETIIRD